MEKLDLEKCVAVEQKPRTCEEFVIEELERTRLALNTAIAEIESLKDRHKKAVDLIEIFKKNAKIQFDAVWITVYNKADKDFIKEELELEEETEGKPNE